MVIGVTVQGIEELQRYLKRVKKDLVSRKTMGRSALVMLGDVTNHFVKGQGPNTKWKSKKIVIGGKDKPLTNTGRLKNSQQASWDSKTAVVGTNLKYGTFQNDGGTIKAKNAKRLFIPLSSRAARKKTGAKIPKGWKFGVDYVLTKKVIKVEARPFMYISKKGGKRIVDVFVKELEK